MFQEPVESASAEKNVRENHISLKRTKEHQDTQNQNVSPVVKSTEISVT